jgi:signal recognition particle GTPase
MERISRGAGLAEAEAIKIFEAFFAMRKKFGMMKNFF